MIRVSLQAHRIVIVGVELVAPNQAVERQKLPGASDLGHLPPVQYADVGGVPGVHARQQLLHDAAAGHNLQTQANLRVLLAIFGRDLAV